MAPLQWPDHWPTSGPVLLRPWSDDDLAAVAELATDPYVTAISTVPARWSEAEGRAYVARQHRRLAEGTGWSFAVALGPDGPVVGSAGLWVHPDRPASAGYAIIPRYRRRGHAAAALHALTAFAAAQTLTRVELFVEPANTASAAVARHAGYRCEQGLARHLEIGGELRDVDLWAVDPTDAEPASARRPSPDGPGRRGVYARSGDDAPTEPS